MKWYPMITRGCLFVILVSFANASLFAQEIQRWPAACQSKDKISLFDGKSLDGWRFRELIGGQWMTDKGEIVYRGGYRNDLISERSFVDFDLHLEFLLEPGANSGVYLRGRYEVQLIDEISLRGPNIMNKNWHITAI